MDNARNNPILFGVAMAVFTFIAMPKFAVFSVVMGVLAWSMAHRIYKLEEQNYGTKTV